MAPTKRIRTELLALGFATAVMALFAERSPTGIPLNSEVLVASQACAESALYLEGNATDARYDHTHRQWVVTDGRSTAWLDARSGTLVEVRFDAPR